MGVCKASWCQAAQVVALEGMVVAARYAQHNVPYLGLLAGVRCASIEWRAVPGKREHDFYGVRSHTAMPVIDFMRQIGYPRTKAAMRPGICCWGETGHRRQARTGAMLCWRHHRHRFEFNSKYLQAVTLALWCSRAFAGRPGWWE